MRNRVRIISSRITSRNDEVVARRSVIEYAVPRFSVNMHEKDSLYEENKHFYVHTRAQRLRPSTPYLFTRIPTHSFCAHIVCHKLSRLSRPHCHFFILTPAARTLIGRINRTPPNRHTDQGRSPRGAYLSPPPPPRVGADAIVPTRSYRASEAPPSPKANPSNGERSVSSHRSYRPRA